MNTLHLYVSNMLIINVYEKHFFIIDFLLTNIYLTLMFTNIGFFLMLVLFI